MKYILSEEEYQDLKRLQDDYSEKKKSELIDFCMLAAKHIPVPRPWMGDDADEQPWGCILDGESDMWMGYCDDCPATEICPYESKNWSQ